MKEEEGGRTQQRRQRKRQWQQQQKERGTLTVERRGGERCALVTVSAGKGGEEVHANDGYAPDSKSEGGVHRLWCAPGE